MLSKLSFGSPVHDALTSKKHGPWEMGTLQRAGRSRWVDHPRTGGIGPRTRTMNRTWLVLSDFGYLAKKYLIYRTTIFDFEWFLRDVVGVLSSVSVLLAEFRSFSAETLITYNLYWWFFAGNSLQIPGESCFAIQGDCPTCCWSNWNNHGSEASLVLIDTHCITNESSTSLVLQVLPSMGMGIGEARVPAGTK